MLRRCTIARERLVTDEPGQQSELPTSARARKSVCIIVRVNTVERVGRTSATTRSVCLRAIRRLLMFAPLPMSVNVSCSIKNAVIPWPISSDSLRFAPSPITRWGHLVHAQQMAVRALPRRYRGHGRRGGACLVSGGGVCATERAELAPASARGPARIRGESLRHSEERFGITEVFFRFLRGFCGKRLMKSGKR